VAVLEVLSEVVRAVELLAAVAFPELVDFLKMSDSFIPILIGSVTWHVTARPMAASREVFAAVAAGVGLAWLGGAVVERPVITRKRGATPAVTSHVEAVLMSLSLILVLEAIATERALVLFFRFMRTVG
jgi:hypothetical protein